MKKLLVFTLFFTFLFPLTAKEKLPDLSPLEMYKPIYFVTGSRSDQSKFQVSFKYSALKRYNYGIFIGYRQLSFWKIYDRSSPFGSTDYNPSVFLKSKYLPFIENWTDYVIISPYEHLSNGRDKEESRSINRFYIQTQRSTGNHIDYGVNIKVFGYYPLSKKNKDYNKYTNYYETKLFVTIGDNLKENVKEELYIKFSGWKKGFIEGGLISRKLWKFNTRVYMQLYHGYLESTIKYNEKTTCLRIGMILK